MGPVFGLPGRHEPVPFRPVEVDRVEKQRSSGGLKTCKLLFRQRVQPVTGLHDAGQGALFCPEEMFLTSSLYLIYLNSSSSKQDHFLWTSHFSLLKSITCLAPNTVGHGLGISGSAGDNWDRQAPPVDKPRVVPALSPEFSEAFLGLFFTIQKNPPGPFGAGG